LPDEVSAIDDLGLPVPIPRRVGRVVSLVPSLTEAIAATDERLLVAATDWCTHPADLDVVRVGGTKNPRVDDITSLRPDVVIANDEENRAVDLDALRKHGIPVWVTAPTTLAEAFGSLDRLLRIGCGLHRPDWLDVAEQVWRHDAGVAASRSAVIPIWRRPWMVLGRDTFAGDVLSRLGIDNAMADSVDRYPKVTLAELRERQPDLVVLPDEPYAFGANDGPEAFTGWGVPVACVSGRHLTWYGPSLVEARDVLSTQLDAAQVP
jgi:ABC-type Fe3+-hydroxamate transport system substrate-binding protein